jgi:predicted KAP-like P-loop ATPase
MYLNDNETIIDLIQYEPVAKSVIALLDKARGHPITIGVHGDWGAGKSSVLAMVQEGLKDKPKTLCLRFNGWTFQGFDDAKLVMLEAIVTEIRAARPGVQKVKEQVGGLIKRIDWLKVAKHAGGLGLSLATGVPLPEHVATLSRIVKAVAADPKGEEATRLVEEAKGLLRDRPSDAPSNVPEEIQSFRDDFKDLLAEAEIDRLVVLVDDLDRCLPKTIVETLEAIRLFLFVDNSAFIIAVDEAMVEYAVRQHFPDLPGGTGAGSYARNYLEKLIQVPFRIPALGPTETRTYIALLLLQCQLPAEEFQPFLAAAKVALAKPWTSRGLDRAAVESIKVTDSRVVDQAFTLAAQLTGLLNDGTNGNPRQVKRFLNSILLREAIAEARGFKDLIDRTVLAKIMLLERFATDQFNELVKWVAASPTGVATELEQLENSVSASAAGMTKDATAARDSWSKEPAAMAWLALEPKIGTKDLRPYVFISRDKRAFSGSTMSMGHLEPLIEQLCGSEFVVANQKDKVAKLSTPEAKTVFNELRERVLTAKDWKTRPPGLHGLATVAEHHAGLQGQLVELLRARPIGQLGAWVPSGWDAAFTESEAKVAFKRLISEWSQQSGNRALQTAAKGRLATLS